MFILFRCGIDKVYIFFKYIRCNVLSMIKILIKWIIFIVKYVISISNLKVNLDILIQIFTKISINVKM